VSPFTEIAVGRAAKSQQIASWSKRRAAVTGPLLGQKRSIPEFRDQPPLAKRTKTHPLFKADSVMLWISHQKTVNCLRGTRRGGLACRAPDEREGRIAIASSS